MSSELGREPDEAYVWAWLPGAAEPVVAGRVHITGDLVNFNYGRSYLERDLAIPLYLPELPLQPGLIAPLGGLTLAGCINDAMPDAWGRRVVMNRLLGAGAESADPAVLGPLTYMLESGSDRIGALDFQASPEAYAERNDGNASLEELQEAATMVEEGRPLAAGLDRALMHGSSVGGARPKVLLGGDGRRLIAKFSSTTDTYTVVKGEFVAMELAARAGIDVAKVELTEVLGKDALLVERFDRVRVAGGERRRMLVSALTMLELDEMMARYASYSNLAQLVRERFTEPKATLRELFGRIVFNVLVGNTDDHARNHAAFWDGEMLTLTPAYDICPQPRSGGEVSQAMQIAPSGYRMSRLSGCADAAATYLLNPAEAREVIDHQIETIDSQWAEVCDLARMSEVERTYFWHRQFFNPYAFEGYR
ncbi:MAG TPA: HipA domain-containing protein [Solirubrobacterales bacterium]|jgi:serine/threonine-protein kinase HipA|nr:HipA domain-containing protein [Solirubrobacterales bacterium]